MHSGYVLRVSFVTRSNDHTLQGLNLAGSHSKMLHMLDNLLATQISTCIDFVALL